MLLSETELEVREFEPVPRRRNRRKLGFVCLTAVASTAVPIAPSVQKLYEGYKQRQKLSEAIGELSQDVAGFRQMMSALISRLAGHQVDFECGIPLDIAGTDSEGYQTTGVYVERAVTGERFVALDNEYCLAILSKTGTGFRNETEALIFGDDYASNRAQKAVLILGHELTHAMGEQNEGLAQCGGVDLYGGLADFLDIDPSVANVDPLSVSLSMQMPDEYRTAFC